MASPFSGFVNAVLVYQVNAFDSFVGDSGNLQSYTEPLVVFAKLGQKSDRHQDDRGDIDLSRITYKGNCVEPITLPESIKAGQKAIAVVGRVRPDYVTIDIKPELKLVAEADYVQVMRDRLFTSVEETGVFFRHASTQSPFYGATILGQVLQGYLVTQVAWGELAYG